MYNSLSEQKAAWLHIDAEDPEALSGVDPDKIRRFSVASGNALKDYRDRQMNNFFPWCIGAIPSPAWAKKVFPELSESDAINALWEQIFASVRVYKDSDPVQEWEKHTAALATRMNILNSYNFKYLKYKNSLGTDLTIELPENHIWLGGAEKCVAGYDFNANMPTEEVFTAPKRDGVNGIVYASKPLVVNGDIADNFSFTFKNGKIVKIQAEKGQELLETAISVDEGSCYLGEVALVPYDSPISNSGILFYNTLFDENASCHLAFGDSYPCVIGGSEMSRDELKEIGLNASIMHEDFMVGTEDLSIIGITHDNKEIPVFSNGNFAF